MGACSSFCFSACWLRTAKPWHVNLAERLQIADIEDKYPLEAKHKELFDVAAVDQWFLPEFVKALNGWRCSGDPTDIDISSLPGVTLEAPGIVSFDCLTSRFCDTLLSEVDHYHSSGLPQRAPNSMNNDGLVVNEIGMRKSFDTVLRRNLLGIAACLFGDDTVRLSNLQGVPLQTENWGGSTLDEHHTFVVRYRPHEDRHLDMHVDDCDVTFNFGLSNSTSFKGSDLAFCGMKGQDDHRQHLLTYKHLKGRCVVHAGKRRHGALNITSGERSSLIMWTKSSTFRWTAEYQQKRNSLLKRSRDLPDQICLSETHDWDYEYLVHKLSNSEERNALLGDVKHPIITAIGSPLLPIPSRKE